MVRHDGGGNRLLAALPPRDFALRAPHLRMVSLEPDAVLVRAGDRIGHVYFPHSGAISFMLDLPTGQRAATAMVGHEGIVGALSVLGPSRSSITAVVRLGGTASQISVSRFQDAFAHSSALRQIVQAHTAALLKQFQHVAACNALHPVEARMARWLLDLHDRADGDVIPITQEVLSQLLGVRRTTVTLVFAKLRASGAVRSGQRGFVEIDRARLQEAACECGEIMRGEIDQIITHAAMRLQLHAAPAAHPHGAATTAR